MKKFVLILGLMFVLCVFGADLVVASEAFLTYRLYEDASSAKKTIAESIIRVKKISADRTSLSRQKQGDMCMINDEFILDGDYSLLKWTRTCEEEDTEFTTERKGNLLVVRGKLKGKNIDKEIELGSRSLYVYPEFSLTKFALSDMKKIKFWTLRRDDISKLSMQAIKKGEEIIVVNGKEVNAIKVYYSITGKLREKYYHHNYYYRRSDGVLLKREEQSGKIEELVKED